MVTQTAANNHYCPNCAKWVLVSSYSKVTSYLVGSITRQEAMLILSCGHVIVEPIK